MVTDPQTHTHTNRQDRLQYTVSSPPSELPSSPWIINKWAVPFWHDLGHRINSVSAIDEEGQFLFKKWLSIVLQRLNIIILAAWVICEWRQSVPLTKPAFIFLNFLSFYPLGTILLRELKIVTVIIRRNRAQLKGSVKESNVPQLWNWENHS